MQKQEAEAGNVLIVAPTIDREGISSVVACQINGLLKQGLTPYLLVIGPFRQDVFHELNCSLPPQQIIQLEQPYTFLSIPALLSVSRLIKPVLNFILENDIRYVIAHAPYAHFLMRLVSQLTGRSLNKFKLIAYFHSLQYKEFPLKKISRTAFNYLNRKLARKFDDAHLFVSESVKADVEEGLFKHRYQKVLYTPVLSNSVTTGSEEGLFLRAPADFTILLPGRLEANKGQLFFLNSLSDLIRRKQLEPKDVSVILAGDGKQKDKIEKYIINNNLESFVSLAGQVTHPVLQQMMKQADLVVVPSFQEGLPLMALEALQTEALLLASDAGGLKEVVKHGETGFLFKAGDSTDCIEKLQFLYLNRDKVLIDQAVVMEDLQKRFALKPYIQNLLQFVYQT